MTEQRAQPGAALDLARGELHDRGLFAIGIRQRHVAPGLVWSFEVIVMIHMLFIPRPDGTLHPLGIPTNTDRVVQTAVMLALEAIFEADLKPEQYAYRPGRDAHGAVVRVMELLGAGHRQVVDADLSGYFDSIPPRGTDA